MKYTVRAQISITKRCGSCGRDETSYANIKRTVDACDEDDAEDKALTEERNKRRGQDVYLCDGTVSVKRG